MGGTAKIGDRAGALKARDIGKAVCGGAPTSGTVIGGIGVDGRIAASGVKLAQIGMMDGQSIVKAVFCEVAPRKLAKLALALYKVSGGDATASGGEERDNATAGAQLACRACCFREGGGKQEGIHGGGDGITPMEDRDPLIQTLAVLE